MGGGGRFWVYLIFLIIVPLTLVQFFFSIELCLKMILLFAFSRVSKKRAQNKYIFFERLSFRSSCMAGEDCREDLGLPRDRKGGTRGLGDRKLIQFFVSSFTF